METMENFILNLIASLITGVLIFFMGLYWKTIIFYYKRELRKFRLLFGEQTPNDAEIFITIDTYLFDRTSSQKPMPFFKRFSDGHVTLFTGPDDEIQRYCSTRAAAYIIDGLRDIKGIVVTIKSDVESISKWSATFINIGSSVTNVKSDHIKKLPENQWLEDDMNGYTFNDGWETGFNVDGDKGIILKIANPHSPGHSLFICSGQKEWGTSGAAWFLAKHWRILSRRFGKNPFLIVVNVSIGSDESAREIKSYGEEKKKLVYRFLNRRRI
jgi:hypothetical protein